MAKLVFDLFEGDFFLLKSFEPQGMWGRVGGWHCKEKQLFNFEWENESFEVLLDMYLQEKDFDKNSFVLQWLLKDIQGSPKVIPYHFYLGNISEFW